jgi:predicted component of type VI protein secretion system
MLRSTTRSRRRAAKTTTWPRAPGSMSAKWPITTHCIKLAQEAIATQTKDLQLAAWLTEALVKTRRLRRPCSTGLGLCRGLVENFWDTLYPQWRTAMSSCGPCALDWIGSRLDVPFKSVACAATVTISSSTRIRGGSFTKIRPRPRSRRPLGKSAERRQTGARDLRPVLRRDAQGLLRGSGENPGCLLADAARRSTNCAGRSSATRRPLSEG